MTIDPSQNLVLFQKPCTLHYLVDKGPSLETSNFSLNISRLIYEERRRRT